AGAVADGASAGTPATDRRHRPRQGQSASTGRGHPSIARSQLGADRRGVGHLTAIGVGTLYLRGRKTAGSGKPGRICSRFFDFAHVFIGKPVPTFPGHALTTSPIGSKRLTPGTLGSYFRPPPKAIERWCAWGSLARDSEGSFVDPSPDPLEPRDQRHPRDQHDGHDASFLCGYGLCPKLFRGAIRTPGACSWSRAGRPFHGARPAGTGESSLSAGVHSAGIPAS